MKKFCTLPFRPIFLAFFTFVFLGKTQAQTFPEQIHFDPVNHRLTTGGTPVEGFYDESVVNTIELWFDQPDYWSLLNSNYQSSTDIPATIIINGDTLDSPAGVHFKGQTSYFMVQNSDKKSFAIALDFEDEDQDYQGYEAYNLHNCFEDPSFLREVLYDHLGRKHIPQAKANFARLYLNGEDWGLYPNIQQLNGDFFEEWFLSNDGTRWRALKPDGGGGPGGPGAGGPFGTGFSTLNWLGPDTTAYQDFYTLKKASKPNPWEDLVNTCDVLNNTPLSNLEAALKNVLDVDRTLWFLGTEIAFADDDSYVFKGGMDYYLYWEPETGRMVPQEVDGNTVMKLNHATWSPFYHENDDRFVLLNRLLAVPELRQRYLAHLRTIIEDEFDQNQADALIDQYFDLVDDIVEADDKKLYSYGQFVSEKNVLKNFIMQRRNYLLNNPEVNAQGPGIANVVFSADGMPFSEPDAGEEVIVTAEVSSASGISAVNLYFAPGWVGAFEKTAMFDDGNHGDGAAGDGIFGATIPGYGIGSYIRFYVEAKADDTPKTASYLPKGAEHDVFIYRVNISGFVPSEVVVNEIMASNSQTVADQDGEFDDWIELFNNSENEVDLSGWHLSDDVNNLAKWTFPQGSVIGGESYLIVWADEDGSQAGLHANFKLSAGGEQLYLTDPAMGIAQEILFSTQETDKGYARIPNGTGDFVIQSPTFNANNETATGTKDSEFAISGFLVFPNPASGQVTVRAGLALPETMTVFNAIGQVFHQHEIFDEIKMDVSDWSPGIYFIKIKNDVQKLSVR